jgi:hypothetical protein
MNLTQEVKEKPKKQANYHLRAKKSQVLEHVFKKKVLRKTNCRNNVFPDKNGNT